MELSLPWLGWVDLNQRSLTYQTSVLTDYTTSQNINGSLNENRTRIFCVTGRYSNR